MIAKCCICNENYHDKDPENDFFIEEGCEMICYDCCNKRNAEFNKRMNEELSKNNQPERSKREDTLIESDNFCKSCGKEKFIPEEEGSGVSFCECDAVL